MIGCDVDAFEENKYVEPSAASSIDNYIRWRTHYEAASDEHYRETNTKLVRSVLSGLMLRGGAMV